MKTNTITVIYDLTGKLHISTGLGLSLAETIECAIAFLKAPPTDHRVDSDFDQFFDAAITIAVGSGAVSLDDSLICISGHGYA